MVVGFGEVSETGGAGVGCALGAVGAVGAVGRGGGDGCAGLFGQWCW